MSPPLSKSRLRAAWIVAVAVDAIQIPVEATGLLGWIVGVGLDVVTMIVLWSLVGFHWAFLPSFLTEWIPYLDYAPLWTLAVLIATRGRGEDTLAAPLIPPHPLKEAPMQVNIGSTDKVLRVVIGLALLSLFFLLEGKARWFGLIGLVPLLTAFTGFCPLYTLLGMNTCPRK